GRKCFAPFGGELAGAFVLEGLSWVLHARHTAGRSLVFRRESRMESRMGIVGRLDHDAANRCATADDGRGGVGGPCGDRRVLGAERGHLSDRQVRDLPGVGMTEPEQTDWPAVAVSLTGPAKASGEPKWRVVVGMLSDSGTRVCLVMSDGLGVDDS